MRIDGWRRSKSIPGFAVALGAAGTLQACNPDQATIARRVAEEDRAFAGTYTLRTVNDSTLPTPGNSGTGIIVIIHAGTITLSFDEGAEPPQRYSYVRSWTQGEPGAIRQMSCSGKWFRFESAVRFEETPTAGCDTKLDGSWNGDDRLTVEPSPGDRWAFVR